MSDDKLRAEADRARRMKEWAHGDDGLFAVFDAVERDYLKTWAGSDIADHPLREKIYHRIAALRDLRTVMQTAIDVGAGAQSAIIHNLRIAEKKAKRA